MQLFERNNPLHFLGLSFNLAVFLGLSLDPNLGLHKLFDSRTADFLRFLLDLWTGAAFFVSFLQIGIETDSLAAGGKGLFPSLPAFVSHTRVFHPLLVILCAVYLALVDSPGRLGFKFLFFEFN